MCAYSIGTKRHGLGFYELITCYFYDILTSTDICSKPTRLIDKSGKFIGLAAA